MKYGLNTKRHDGKFLYATLSYTSTGWDLISNNNNFKYQKELKVKKNIVNARLVE